MRSPLGCGRFAPLTSQPMPHGTRGADELGRGAVAQFGREVGGGIRRGELDGGHRAGGRRGDDARAGHDGSAWPMRCRPRRRGQEGNPRSGRGRAGG